MKPTLILLCLSGLAVNLAAHAGPFLVSDPYPTGAPQPDTCTLREAGKPPIVAPVVRNADNTVHCRIDLAGTALGVHAVSVSADSAVWGSSPETAFSFTAAIPAKPANIRLVAH